MIATILRFLGSPLGAIGTGLLLGAAIGLAVLAWDRGKTIDALGASLEAKVAEIAGLKRDVADKKADVTQLQAALDTQNATIASLGAKADQERLAYQKRLKAAERTASGLQRDADAILAMTIETNDALGRCEAAKELLKETLQ